MLYSPEQCDGKNVLKLKMKQPKHLLYALSVHFNDEIECDVLMFLSVAMQQFACCDSACGEFLEKLLPREIH
jgi:hypothetical protein